MEPVSAMFMTIPPRHQRALETLVLIAKQPHRDLFGAIGTGALRDEDDPFTLEQIVQPLFERGLIENLSQTELGSGGQYFVRITPLGQMCLALGYMLREPRRVNNNEMKLIADALPPEPMTMGPPPTATMRVRNPYDPNEEKEAIA